MCLHHQSPTCNKRTLVFAILHLPAVDQKTFGKMFRPRFISLLLRVPCTCVIQTTASVMPERSKPPNLALKRNAKSPFGKVLDNFVHDNFVHDNVFMLLSGFFESSVLFAPLLSSSLLFSFLLFSSLLLSPLLSSCRRFSPLLFSPLRFSPSIQRSRARTFMIPTREEGPRRFLCMDSIM